MFFKIIALKNLQQIIQESICSGVFFNKIAGPQNCKYIKKRLQHRFFAVNFVNYPRTIIFQGYDSFHVLKIDEN